ncbi:MAG: hypothetical protein CMO26_06240 [Thiotrichales bacterium]|nr:hypothetical protein [Thiotrichales bacterium]|tara:strand:+ start:1178 stop:2188 length:1011 start_codon:yes stop_codon:yes gene_type:complete
MAHLTIIDIAPLFHEDRHARRVIDERIGRAILEAGGFVIANYPDADRVDARALTLLEFFELSNEIKFSVASRAMNPEGSRIYRGYFASLGPDSWAHNEIYDIGPEDPVGGPAILGMDIFAETNIWPAVEPVPGWRQAMRAYRDHMGTVARAVMLSISRAAGFTDEDLLSRFEGGNSTLRLLNYPARSGSSKVVNEFPDDRFIDDEGLTLATGRHTDAAGVSLLWQRQPGLQAQAPDGSWRDVPRLENCISVHLGTALEIMTNGLVPATPHRVIDQGTPRQSVGFFLEPALGAQLAPVEAEVELSDAVAAVRGTYGWHLQARFHEQKGYEHLVPYPE